MALIYKNGYLFKVAIFTAGVYTENLFKSIKPIQYEFFQPIV